MKNRENVNRIFIYDVENSEWKATDQRPSKLFVNKWV